MKYKIWLTSYSGYGISAQRELLGMYGSPEGVYEVSSAEHKEGMELAKRCEEKCYEKGIYVVQLSELGVESKSDLPLMLYCRGNHIKYDCPKVSIVGTRHPTEYGKHMTEKIAEFYTDSGYIVVSGLAYGIDSLAHKTCLDKKGFTIAVLAGSVDDSFNRGNKILYEEIIEKGLVVSEYPPGTVVHAQQFAVRDRIIAGLSETLVVTEAGKKSGALITAEYANKYGKSMYAVPGRLDSEASEGCNLLISKGHAKLFSFDSFGSSEATISKHSKVENTILNLLKTGNGSFYIPELSGVLGVSQNELAELLFNLELEGEVSVLGDVVCLL